MNNVRQRLVFATMIVLVSLILAGSTVATAADDWIRIDEFPCSFEESERIDSFTPNEHGDALFFTCERGLEFYLWVRADDLQGGDRRGAAAQIEYFVDGRTKPERRIAAFDATPNDKPVIASYQARVPVLGLQGRACLSQRGERNTVDAKSCDRFH
jgi:hypothetical protein